MKIKMIHLALPAFVVLALIILPDSAWARAGGGGGGSSSSGGFLNMLLFIIFAPFIYISAKVMKGMMSKKSKQSESILNIAASKDSLWDQASINARIETTYFKVQEAWALRDQDIAKEYMSDRLYAKHKMQTDIMISNGQKNVLGNINLKEFKILQALDYSNDSKDSFLVHIDGSMVDYTVIEETDEMISGAKESRSFQELWRFIRADHGWVLDEIDQEVTFSDLSKIKPSASAR